MTSSISHNSQGLVPLSSAEFSQALCDVIYSELCQAIRGRGRGHCMRVSDLDDELMLQVAQALKDEFRLEAQVHVLSSNATPSDELLITSTKLVELRNPLLDGKLRQPLLVFVPNGLKASAEDSFGDATFERVEIRHAYERLNEQLLALFPVELRGCVEDLLTIVSNREWQWADPQMVAHFLLTIRKNQYEAEVVGAALYEIGLLPDFALLDDLHDFSGRLLKNINCVQTLTNSSRTERGKIIELKLSNQTDSEKALIRALGDFFIQQGLEDPLEWTRAIALEQRNWRLSFDKWAFAEGNSFATQVCVEVVDNGVTELVENKTGHTRLSSLINQPVLIVGAGGQKSFKVTFRVTPAPENVATLDHFKIQIISRESGAPVGVAKKKKAWTGSRAQASISFTKLPKMDWEEGWHYVRIQAYTKDNDLIPVVDENGQTVNNQILSEEEAFRSSINESDLFYVVVNDDIEAEPTENKYPQKSSLAHALIELRFNALKEGRDADAIQALSTGWVEDDGAHASSNLIEARFSKEGTVRIPVCRFLKDLELRILKAAEAPLSWRVRIDTTNVHVPSNGLLEMPRLPETDVFLDARRELFKKLLRGEDSLISVAADFSELRSEILEYGESYLQLLSAAMTHAERFPEDKGALKAIHRIISVDRVDIDLIDHRNNKRRVSLVGPTHPLRIMWLLNWSLLGQDWLKKSVDCDPEMLVPTRDGLIDRLKLINFPASVISEDGRVLSCIENIHPFWSFYASGDNANPRGLIAELCTAIQLPEPNGDGLSLSPSYLADRVRRYLVQHPYVETLAINCFNPGRGKLISEMLLELQSDPSFRGIRYDIRLFVPDPEGLGVGEDLQHLVSPSSSLAENADAFCSPTGNHLAPKLSFSIRATREFERTPSVFPANLSMLFDLFPAQQVSAVRAVQEEEAAPIHGLLQDYRISYSETDEDVCWNRSPRHSIATEYEGAEDVTSVLSKLAEALSNGCANIATNQAGLKLRPATTLHLDSSGKAMLHHVHEVSDWVFTVDRNLGIEFFDHGGLKDRPEYLIDHSPDFAASFSPRLVITSRSLTEIEVLFEQALKERELPNKVGTAPQLLGALRALSGRLALKLISTKTQRAEALGLALSKLYLDYQGALKDQIVVPLDAHLELYKGLKGNSSGGAEVSLKRTDLALFEFNASEPATITCRLVEVKCYSDVGSLSAYTDLKDRISEQILQSEAVIREHFDPQLNIPNDRPDRSIKSQELVSLLEFYVDRAHRLGNLSAPAWEEAKFILRNIESGYRLQFTKSAVIFDLEKDGTDEAEEDFGIEYHRVGRNMIVDLLNALGNSEKSPAEAFSTSDLTIPLVRKAAFKSDYRERTVHWGREKGSLDESDAILPITKSEPDDRPVISPKIKVNELESPDIAKAAPVTSQEERIDTTEEPEVTETGSEQTISKSAGDLAVEPLPDVTEEISVDAECDVLIGEPKPSPQYGLLGECNGRTLGLDLNSTHTISLFGVQGGGKSYTLGSIIEMATMAIPGINKLPSPLASVVFHYSQTQDYKPEFTSMVRPNDDEGSLKKLIEKYKARPQGLSDVVLLTPGDKYTERCEEYPDIEVMPLKFAASELQAQHWRFLMGAIGNQAMYIRQINRMLKGLRRNLTLENLKDAIENSGFGDREMQLAQDRLALAEDYIDDSVRLSDVIRPGRMIIVDLRDEFIEKDEALGLFVVILQIFSEAKWNGDLFSKLVVFDEAHKYIESPDLVAGLIEVVREMRHKATSILVASQDPPSVPVALIELSSQIILHKFNSPSWLKHIQKANAALSNLTPAQMAQLKPGEAFIWSSKATDSAFSHQALKAKLRPRVTAHGGATKTAVK